MSEPDQRDEEERRRDRQMIELLNELRVALQARRTPTRSKHRQEDTASFLAPDQLLGFGRGRVFGWS